MTVRALRGWAAGVVLIAAVALPGVRHLDVEVDVVAQHVRIVSDMERPPARLLVERPAADDGFAQEVAALPGVVDVVAPTVDSSVLASFPEDERPSIAHAFRGKPAPGRSFLLVEIDRGVEVAPAIRSLDPEARVVGASVLDRAHERAAGQELLWLACVLSIALGGALVFVLRRVTTALVVLGSVAVGWGILAGSMGWAGLSLGGPNLLLLPLVTVLGLADGIHFVNENRARDGDVVGALREVAVPCALTSATTAFAFLALLLSPSDAIRQFGLLAAGGMGIAWVVGLVLPAAVLSGWPEPETPERVVDIRVPTLGLAALFGVLGVGGMRVEPDLKLGGELLPDDPVLVEMREVEEALGGWHAVELRVDTRRPEGVGDREAARTLVRLHEQLDRDPAVGSVLSYADPLRWVARAQDMDRQRLLAPRVRKAFAQRSFDKVHGEVVRRSGEAPLALFDDDRSAYVLHVRLRDVGAAAWHRTFQRARQVVRPYGFEAAGHPALMVAAYQRIVPEALRIVGASLLAVVLVLGIRTRRVRTVVVGLGVLAATVGATLGAMGLLGISLTHAHVFVLSLAAGIGVDGWIHLSTCHPGARERVRSAVLQSGLVWLVGFAALGLSRLPTLRGIGLVLLVGSVANVALTLWVDRRS